MKNVRRLKKYFNSMDKRMTARHAEVVANYLLDNGIKFWCDSDKIFTTPGKRYTISWGTEYLYNGDEVSADYFVVNRFRDAMEEKLRRANHKNWLERHGVNREHLRRR